MQQLKTVQFHSDRYQLIGTLHMPEKKNPSVVIGCHGLFSSRESAKQIALAQACNREGIAYFRFDHRGCGQSQGDFKTVTSLPNRCRDLLSAIRAIQDCEHMGSRLGLFGSSFGGTVALAVAGHYKIAALATYAAPINSATINHVSIQNTSRPSHEIGPELEKTLRFDITSDIQSIQNILIIHSQNDETVPLAHARQIHRIVIPPKKLIEFKGGDHNMSIPSHQSQFVVELVHWFKKHGF